MRRSQTTAFLALIGLFLVGPLPQAAAAKPEVVYFYDGGVTLRVHAFALDTRGKLTELPGSPFATNNPPFPWSFDSHALAYSARDRTLFAAGANGISAFRVEQDGALSRLPGSPFGGAAVLGLAVVTLPGRTFVYATELRADQLRGYSYEDETLRELPSSPYASQRFPTGITATAGGCIYVTHSVSTFLIQTISESHVMPDGSLVPDPSFPYRINGGLFYNCYTDPKGKFLYMPHLGQPKVFVFDIRRRCWLLPVRGSPFATGVVPRAALAVSKKHVVVIDWFDRARPFSVLYRSRTGELVPLKSGVQGQHNTGTIYHATLDTKGKFLVVTVPNEGAVVCYRMSRRSGRLTFASQVTGVSFSRPTFRTGILVIKLQRP